ncbi:MAG: glycosyl hydrolase [Nitrososphaerota archaeon]|nr:glycosyl hydrolase [Nitrososphaerota archaeon]
MIMVETESIDQEDLHRSIAEKFKDPPSDCGLFVRWWWFGPAVTREEINRELEIMKSTGVCGIEIQPVYPLNLNSPEEGIRNLRFLSSEFLEALRFAVKRACDLGMIVDVTLGSGWPYGGPHIPIHLSAGCIKYEVRHADCKDGVCNPSRLEVPKLRVDERIIAVMAARKTENGLDPESVVELTDLAIEGETIELKLPDGEWQVMFFVEGHTLQEVKRAALGAEGYVMDHYDPKALMTHLEIVGEPLIAAGKGRIRAVFCDSLEVFGSNWTPNLLEEFKKRRGYDLKPYLPALWNKYGDKTELVRIDFGRTLSELATKNFIMPLQEWCRKNGVLLRMQQYGVPAIDLSGYKYVDLPEGEGRNFVEISPMRWASSAAHQYGKAICSAEAFTFLSSMSMYEPYPTFPGIRFSSSLEDLKAASDIYFIQGANHLIAHGYSYSPPSAGVPGWVFYASELINHNNTWWKYFSHLTTYIRRVSFLLRQGRPVVDVAIYLPLNDAWAKSQDPSRLRIPQFIPLNNELIRQILRSGYSFDFVTDDTLKDAKIGKGSLTFNGAEYRIIVLPQVSFMPIESVKKIYAFFKSGGAVIAISSLPNRDCRFDGREDESASLKQIMDEIFGKKNGKGRAILVKDYGEELARALRESVPPDIQFLEDHSDLGFVHRRIGTLDFYFVANTGYEKRKVKAVFRAGHRKPRIWDPFTGDITAVNVYSFMDKGTLLTLDLEPHGSKIIEFAEPSAESPIIATNFPEVLDIQDHKHTLKIKARANIAGEYYVRTRNAVFNIVVDNIPPSIPLNGPWEITFHLEGGDRRFRVEKLVSWTDLPEYRFYSGSATYAIDVSLPEEYVTPDLSLQLDLGVVREVAEVYINGVRAGVTWRHPHIIDVTALIRSGPNNIKVTVTNLLINKVLGMQSPDYTALKRCYGERFPTPIEYNKPVSPLPSGLIGPAKIIPYKIVDAVFSK